MSALKITSPLHYLQLIVVISFCSLSFQKSPSKKKKAQQSIPVKNYTLVWSDEFSGTKLDLQKWNYHQLGRRRQAVNIKETVFLDGEGFLHLQVKEENNQVYAAMISTKGLFETRYGYFECRAKLTKAKGIWPAFWLNSKINRDHGTPEKNGVEIDVFEYFRNLNPNAVTHNLHWGGYGATHKELGFIYTPLNKAIDSFHTFGLEWTDTSYAVFVNGAQAARGNMYISKVPEHILLSVECDENGGGPLERNKLPDEFIVDYVRVYKRNNILAVK